MTAQLEHVFSPRRNIINVRGKNFNSTIVVTHLVELYPVMLQQINEKHALAFCYYQIDDLTLV